MYFYYNLFPTPSHLSKEKMKNTSTSATRQPVVKFQRDPAMEAQIARRMQRDRETNTNSYGGMGMDTCTPAEMLDRMNEIGYMRSLPDVYGK